jgi:uncharacterized protein YigE (DUF2233 family)
MASMWLFLACQPAPRPAPPPPAPPAPLGPAARFAGSAIEVRERRWRDEGDAGQAWLVGVPRASAKVEVRPSAAVAPFAELAPPDAGPWATINGGFYDDQGAAMGLVVAGGQEWSAFRKGGGSGVLEAAAGQLRVVHRDEWQPSAVDQALQSIDRLVDGGLNLVKDRPGAPRAARSAVALAADRVWLVVAVSDDSVEIDGEDVQLKLTSGHGMTLHGFADFIVEHTGAIQALNLDGAVSTQLAIRDGGRRFEVRGELGTINALVVRP